MSEPGWLSYTGAITGVIGAVTGIAGAIMGYISYRHSEQLKALDLRLELRKTEADLRSAVQELPSLLERAKKSRDRVTAATGLRGSGALQQWTSDWEADLAAVRALEGELPDANANHISAKHSELESKLVAVHALASRAERLRDKYQEGLAADDREREHIRADLRVRTQANLEGKQ
jgi:hypothetical protein